MFDFWKDLFSLGFLQRGLIATLLAAPAVGMVGSLVYLRKLSSLAGAMAHASLGGIGLFVFLKNAYGFENLSPFVGGLLAALSSAVLLSWLKFKGNLREDNLINALWSVGMAVGLIFLAHTPGYQEGLESWLFGNLFLLSPNDLVGLVALDFFILFFCVKFYHSLELTAFDENFAITRGVKVFALYTGLLCVVALAIMLLMHLVGLVLVIALFSLPTATVSTGAKSLKGLMLSTTILCLTYGVLGLWLSYSLDWPPGPSIVLLAGMFFIGRHLFIKRKN
jgi:zinc transport system permease protein